MIKRITSVSYVAHEFHIVKHSWFDIALVDVNKPASLVARATDKTALYFCPRSSQHDNRDTRIVRHN